MNPTGSWHWSCFILGKLFWLTYRIVVPAIYLPFGHVLALSFVADLVVSYYLALIFQVNHVVSPAIWPKANNDTGGLIPSTLSICLCVWRVGLRASSDSSPSYRQA